MALADFFGELRGPVWREGEIELANGARVKALGVGQQIRGKKEKRSRRPDFIVCDDLEDEENARTEEARKKMMSWVMRALLPAMHPSRGRLRVIGTPMGTDSLMVKLSRHSGFRTVRFPVLKEDGSPQWPERFGVEQVESVRELYVEAGDPDGFEQEYMLNPVGKENVIFAVEKVGRMAAALMPQGATVTMTDPARKSGGKVARTGHVAYRWVGETLYVLEARGFFHRPSETIDTLFQWSGRWEPVEVGIEKDGLEDYLMEPLWTAMGERGVTLPVVAQMAPRDRDKATFLLGLQPYVEAGRLVVSEHCADRLAEMETFPRGRVDVLNALAYAVKRKRGKSVYQTVLQREDVRLVAGRETWLVGESDGANGYWWMVCQVGETSVHVVECGKGLARSLMDEWPSLVTEKRMDVPGLLIWTTGHDERYASGLGGVMRRKGILYRRGGSVPPGCMAAGVAQGEVRIGKEASGVLHAVNGGYRWEGDTGELQAGDGQVYGRLCEVAWSAGRARREAKNAPRHYKVGG